MIMLLDPDTELIADVRACEWYEPAEDYFPSTDRRVSVWPSHYVYGGNIKPYAGVDVKPYQTVAWTRVK